MPDLGRADRIAAVSARLSAHLVPRRVLVAVHPWPEAVRLHRHLDADPRLSRISEHVDEESTQTFAVAVDRRD